MNTNIITVDSDNNQFTTTKERNEREDENFELKVCFGGVHCLKLEDKKHSTQFKHFKPVHFSFIHLSFSLFSLFLSCQLISLFDCIFTQINTT
jgi:hypothetical protein